MAKSTLFSNDLDVEAYLSGELDKFDKPEAFVFLFSDEKDLLAPNFNSIVAGTHAMHGPELTVLFRNY